jgi:hypothetical protein
MDSVGLPMPAPLTCAGRRRGEYKRDEKTADTQHRIKNSSIANLTSATCFRLATASVIGARLFDASQHGIEA